jgi:hypothetical protein
VQSVSHHEYLLARLLSSLHPLQLNRPQLSVAALFCGGLWLGSGRADGERSAARTRSFRTAPLVSGSGFVSPTLFIFATHDRGDRSVDSEGTGAPPRGKARIRLGITRLSFAESEDRVFPSYPRKAKASRQPDAEFSGFLGLLWRACTLSAESRVSQLYCSGERKRKNDRVMDAVGSTMGSKCEESWYSVGTAFNQDKPVRSAGNVGERKLTEFLVCNGQALLLEEGQDSGLRRRRRARPARFH